MSRHRNQIAVTAESHRFHGTCGESVVACRHEFVPAFRDNADGRVELARLPNGKPAPMHLIAGLPRAWATRCDEGGNVLELIDSVVAGFVKNDRFYTREEAAQEI